ncbi:ABC transporter ATP-binding protein [Ilumatobacter sp.]|uniref:ABC transporter ATP-binding protein n=1 Tax=Ilumatobacter sp. TaxID=1967498 RepID=UPI003AF5D628
MTDEHGTDPSALHGRTSGGGGAANAVQDHPNPVEGVFDDVSPTPGSAKVDPILITDDVTKRFGGLIAVDVDHLEIQRGAITALIGPNGAGKTTFFNLLTSFDKMNTGKVVLDGKDISDVPSYRLANQGMVRTFQLTKALSRMSVIDNMKLGATHQEGEHFWKALLPIWHSQERQVEERADALLDRFNLTHMRDEYAGTMSGGQRKLVEMARALMTEPRLVMLDEPMAGVNPALTQSLLGHVKGLRAEGRTVIFVEHDMDVVQDISDWVVVMAEGRIIAEGTPDDIAANQAVIDAYLGAHRDSDLSEWDDDEVPLDPEGAVSVDANEEDGE